ncbi:MAG: ABC transporter ATP-binding protein/permease [Xanthomonadales bacterium]|nr:ATM1-type heavy metal exporter [Xanthomonadales bacterium]MCC6592324.1 ABC transporter ATP-binding protein/permease [Xanthomonadales bacterium]MCE7931726.1 ABC transporter ATP-binding protein/permease [Xanthomonadales bacterium PRO6]
MTPATPARATARRVFAELLPYVRQHRWRVLLVLALLAGAKLANLGVPIGFKAIVDALSPAQQALAVPVALLLGYGVLRLSAAIAGELRTILFARVHIGARRAAALQTFRHVHQLGLRFHLERRTGGLSRIIERGTGAIEDFLYYCVITIAPTLFEVAIATGFLLYAYPNIFALATLLTLAAYVAVTIVITEWRTRYYRRMHEADNEAAARAVDSLLNYETVKYFANEDYEAKRYDEQLGRWQAAAEKSWFTLGVLNAAQAIVIAIGLTVLMVLAAREVAAGRMTVGDLVLVNTLLIQLFVPLNILGMMYRDIKQALTDLQRMFELIGQTREIVDAPDAPDLAVRGGSIRFEQVGFAYDPRRPILHGVDFEVPAGHTIAVVGASGAGKSTLARLLYRFYEVGAGAIRIDGQDLRAVSQHSLRAAIGIVPQDTVLFNDTLYTNIAYGRPQASREEIIAAAKAAQIHDFIERLPDGYDTVVGERGLKLSGGEKQRVAIARTILKNPPILLFDEATSALDTATEREIQAQLDAIAQSRTTLVIAHRLSTVVGADQILVMDGGRVVERGTHEQLLEHEGAYAKLWALQQAEAADALDVPS